MTIETFLGNLSAAGVPDDILVAAIASVGTDDGGALVQALQDAGVPSDVLTSALGADSPSYDYAAQPVGNYPNAPQPSPVTPAPNAPAAPPFMPSTTQPTGAPSTDGTGATPTPAGLPPFGSYLVTGSGQTLQIQGGVNPQTGLVSRGSAASSEGGSHLSRADAIISRNIPSMGVAQRIIDTHIPGVAYGREIMASLEQKRRR